MWHEARKQEKRLRTMVVDYKRRAERRKLFYDQFKADPTQFMQVHGRPCKIYLDAQITAAADSCMMPWQGDKENMIDRFDVRAHLDIIPEYKVGTKSEVPEESEENSSKLNYERYRILIQHELSKMSEDKFLHQIHLEEQFGTAVGPGRHKHNQESVKPAPRAAIGYTYEDSNPTGSSWSASGQKASSSSSSHSNDKKKEPIKPKSDSEEDSEEELDFDLLVNMDELTFAQKAELNINGTKYGLPGGEFMEYLNADLEDKENMRLAKLQEQEKQQMSGRKARRERRAYKDKLILRKGYISPPSYAAQNSLTLNEEEDDDEEEKKSSSGRSSRSSSKEKIEFITSFGGNESEKEEHKKSSIPLTTFGPSLPSSGGLPRQTRKWAKSRSRSPEKRIMRSSRSRRDRNRRKRSDSSSSGSSNRRRRYRRKSSSSSSGSQRSRTKERRRSNKRSERSRSRNRNLKSSRSKSRDIARKNRRKRSSSDERPKRRGRRSSSKSSSSSSRSSKKRKLRIRKRSSSSDSSTTRKSKSKEPLSLPSNSSPNQQPSSSNTKNGNGSINLKIEQTEVNVIMNPPEKLPSPPVKRYYGRKKNQSDSKDESDNSSSSSSSNESSSKRVDKNSGGKGKSNVNSLTKIIGSGSSSGVITPQERLKRKMQAALNRQLKVDKAADKEKKEKLELERLEREETLRQLTIKYRRREREKRHLLDNISRSPSLSSEGSSPSSSSRRRSRSNSPMYF